MFQVARVPTYEYTCPNGHILPEAEPDYRMRYCPTCTTRLEEQELIIDIAICDICFNRVDPEWECCPYCGNSK